MDKKRGKKDKGQTTIETALIVAAGLVVLSSIILLNQDAFYIVNTQFRDSRANAALDDIAEAASLVYEQGPGSKNRVYVNFPPRLGNVSIMDGLIKIDTYPTGYLYRYVAFNVSGNFSASEGGRWITIENFGDGVGFVEEEDIGGGFEPAELYCGDTICSPEEGEDCSSCAADCVCLASQACENQVCCEVACFDDGDCPVSFWCAAGGTCSSYCYYQDGSSPIMTKGVGPIGGPD